MTLGLTLFFYWLSLAWVRLVRLDASIKVNVATLFIISPFVVYPFVYSPVWWLRGLTGDLSLTTTVLLVAAVYVKLFDKKLIATKERKLMLWSVVGFGVVFYPLALGVGQLDPYVWGYANVYMLGMVLGLSLLLFLRQYYVFATTLLLAVLAWNVGLLQSVNLWDYLLDPFIFFYALLRLLR
ncbi:hypothetical protein [Ghiorsea bivora]|uniref:hypothetical protein n=1 Tax=Ghiorsea bivora TaxID=1485545 RepID=UPI00057009E4|nr:hypothetical protein [Ghiorsea bivora]